jgi:nicotinamidase-related amidase
MKPSVPAHAAVLVVDVQTGIFGADPPPLEAEAVVARINAVMSKARQAGVPVLFMQHDGEPGGEDVVPFTNGWKLHPDLDVRPTDPVIRKTTCDAFYGTSLESELRSRGITTLLLTGYATEFCVDSTLRSAASKGFDVLVVADAHTTSDNPVLKAETVRQQHNWIWANYISQVRIRVLKAAELHFSPAAAP